MTNRRGNSWKLYGLGAACLAAVFAFRSVARAGPDLVPAETPLAPLPAPTGPSSAPTAVPSYASLLLPTVGDLPARLDDAVRRWAAVLAAGGEDAPRAKERLLETQRAVLATLEPYVDDNDLEVRLRVGEVMEEMIVEARVTRMLASLPQDQRSRLLQFRHMQPGAFSLMLSQDWSQRAKAVRKLTRRSDPQRLAEPLVVLCLRHHSTELVSEAAEAAERCDYRSDAVVEALAQALGRFQGEPENRSIRYGLIVASPTPTLCEALGNIGGPRAARALVDALPGGARGMMTHSPFLPAVIDSLVATGEKRAIPTLLLRLNPDDRAGRASWNFGNGTGTAQSTDYAFYAILRISMQSPSEYKLLIVDYSQLNSYPGAPFYVGFAKDKDRRDAYEKVKNWWTANREKSPYKGMEPLEAVSKEPRSQPATAPQPAPAAIAASTPATRSAPPARPSGPALPPAPPSDEVASAARRYAEAFRSPSFPLRDAVRHKLLDLYCASLQGLADAVEDRDSESGKRLLDALSEAVTEVGIHSASFQLPPEMRKKLAAFLAAQPKIARNAFDLNWSGRAEAADALASLADANALAEPIVLLFLKDPAPQISQAALKLAATGNYRSDAVVDALTDMLTAASETDWNRYSGSGSDNPVQGVLATLTKIRSPRAAPVLMAMWMQRSGRGYGFSEGYSPALGDALVATAELGIMPHLLEKLKESRGVTNTTTSKGKPITYDSCDVPLLVLVRLAGQDPNDYQIMTTNDYGTSHVGFKDDTTRKAAVKKFNDWWSKARLAPPYKDLQPISIPDLAPSNSSRLGSDSED